MRKIILTLLTFTTINSFADQALPNLIKDLNANVKNSGTISPTENCGNCAGIVKTELKSFSLPGSPRSVDLSVISLDKANLLVSNFLHMKDIPFEYALDGCFARAHKMATLLDQEGIVSGKAFIQGRLFASTNYGPVNWRYHVAPIVLVDDNGTTVPYVLDPSLSDKAMKYDDWKNLISNGGRPPSKNPKMAPRVLENVTKRFVYDVTSINVDMNEYQPGDLADMDQQLAHYLELKKQLDQR